MPAIFWKYLPLKRGTPVSHIHWGQIWSEVGCGDQDSLSLPQPLAFLYPNPFLGPEGETAIFETIFTLTSPMEVRGPGLQTQG